MCSTKVVLMLEPKKCVVHADAASQLQRPQQLLASRRFELSSYFERVRGHFSPLSQLTFEVSWHQRQDARPEPQKMYTVPVARAWWPAVGAQLDRGVRRHLALPVLCCSDELPKALAPDNNSAVLGWFDAARNGDHEILEGLYVAYSNHLLLQAVEV